ncbi:hypothetical protein [Escherichia coli]|uniref:DUF7210 family protein n=1 Tax=Escherichia coli TaxID=562 RepID=UPI001C8FDAD7|nr:hypothetical protein [Escherichia coli]MBY2955025.1 hypothetical protein [Escherichia coli]
MKLIALKPIYFGGTVVTEGLPLETLEQHGRELIKKGYAKLEESENPAKQEQQQEQQQEHQQKQPELKAENKAKK